MKFSNNTALSEKLPLNEKVAYGLGDFASSMFWKLFSMFLLFFYTDVFGISAAAVGTMFLVTRIWDSANDPIMGIIGDRTSTKWGKFRPYLLWIAVPFGIIDVLTFTTPDLSESGKLIYAYITYTLMMMVYTAVDVPYGSLMGVMSNNGDERTPLASWRFIRAFSGGLFVIATANYLVEYFSERTNQAVGFQYTIGLYAVVALVLFILVFLGTKERVLPTYFSDGYFTLLPNEKRTLEFECDKDKFPDNYAITVEGFNIKQKVLTHNTKKRREE